MTRSGSPQVGSRREGWLGPILARVRLNAIAHRLDPAGRPLIAKRRHWFSPALIGPGNLYLRWMNAGVVVLGDRAWRARERLVHQRLYGIGCATDPAGWLLMPAWPGVSLASYLADESRAPDDRLGAMLEASRALGALHRVAIDWPGDPHRGLTHGDATLRNVHFDPATRRAHWYDCDTIHAPEVAPLARRADDLRALLYSAVEVGSDLPVPALLGSIRAGSDDLALWGRLRKTLRSGRLHFSPYHFAQARPPIERRRELESILRADQ